MVRKGKVVRQLPVLNAPAIFNELPQGKYKVTHSLYERDKLLLRKGNAISESKYSELRRNIEKHPQRYHTEEEYLVEIED
jgi:hypothetical protein